VAAPTSSPMTCTISPSRCSPTEFASPLRRKATRRPERKPRTPCGKSSRAYPSPFEARTMAATAPDSNFDLPPTSSPSLVSRTPPTATRRPGPIRKLFARFRPPRRLKFTREGKYFLGITLGVGFAAINTGNNLLYLLLGMLLALIIVSGAMSELALRNLTITRRLPARAQAGRPHVVEIEVHNRKKRLAS